MAIADCDKTSECSNTNCYLTNAQFCDPQIPLADPPNLPSCSNVNCTGILCYGNGPCICDWAPACPILCVL